MAIAPVLLLLLLQLQFLPYHESRLTADLALLWWQIIAALEMPSLRAEGEAYVDGLLASDFCVCRVGGCSHMSGLSSRNFVRWP